MNISFDEKDKEYYKGAYLPTVKTPKYEKTKEKVVDILMSGKYKDLNADDFWILMNTNKAKDKMLYSSLIISHNGCLKINDCLEDKFKPNCVVIDKEGFNNSLVFIYEDINTYEVGEVNSKNCSNDYPYAMAFKRCFDRVVLKKSKLAYMGVYSDSEAEEFTQKTDEEQPTQKPKKEPEKVERYMSYEHYNQLKEALNAKHGSFKSEDAIGELSLLCQKRGISNMKQIPDDLAEEIIKEIKETPF